MDKIVPRSPSMLLKQAKPGFKNIWLVTCGKSDFELNQEQAQLLKDATVKGMRGIIWFDDFAISIPHIQSITRVPIQEPITWEQLDEAKKRGMIA